MSNIHGPVAARDNNGFIARLDPSGGAAVRFIEGGRDGVTLHAPKGLALGATTLWVADLDTVRGFDRHSGRPVAEVVVPGATFLNDIAASPTGELYVTDSGVGPDAMGNIVATGTDAIHRIDRSGSVHSVATGTQLNQPNGIYRYANGWLAVTTRGADEVMVLDWFGNVVCRYTVPGHVVDGIQVLRDGRLVVTTWQQPGLWLLHADGAAEPLLPGSELDGAADFSVDRLRGLLLLPALLRDQLQVVRIPHAPIHP